MLCRTGFLEGVYRVGLDGLLVVGDRAEVGVEEDFNVVILLGKLEDLVGNGLSLGESWDVLADIGKAQNNALALFPLQLRLALLTKNNQVGIGVVQQLLPCSLGQCRVNTTAETLIRRGDDNEGLGLLRDLGFGLLVDLVGSFTEGLGLGHCSHGAVEFCRGDNLHGVGNLLDVSDGLETSLDFPEGGISGGWCESGDGRSRRWMSDVSRGTDNRSYMVEGYSLPGDKGDGGPSQGGTGGVGEHWVNWTGGRGGEEEGRGDEVGAEAFFLGRRCWHNRVMSVRRRSRRQFS